MTTVDVLTEEIGGVVYWFDEDAGDRAVRFFPRFLTHSKGEHAGQPFELLDWQERIIRDVFGWMRPDGFRRYRRVYIEVPRKNGKSQLGAGVGLYLTFSDGEAGAEVYSAAADRFQASIVFQAAADMREASDELAKQSTAWKKSIVVDETKSSYQVLSSDVATKHGLNAHGIIFDELHTQPNRELWDVLTTSVGARRQPLVFAITTAGHDRNSICYEQHIYAVGVLDGTIVDPEFYAVIFAADDDADWREESVWVGANPSLGQTVKWDYIRAECKRAMETPGYVNTFRRLQLNQWTESFSRWLDIEAWNESGEPIDPSELLGLQCWGGLDLSTTTDLSAFVLFFPWESGYAVLCWFWVPEESVRTRSRQDRAPYDVWVRDGYITATEGNVIDYDFIVERIKELSILYDIQEIGFDPWNAGHVVKELMDDGANMVSVRQGYVTMSEPSKELAKMILGRNLYHQNNPVLKWCAANAVIETDATDNIKPTKKKSTERIDGIVAAIIALSRAMGGDGDSVYEGRGFLGV